MLLNAIQCVFPDTDAVFPDFIPSQALMGMGAHSQCPALQAVPWE